MEDEVDMKAESEPPLARATFSIRSGVCGRAPTRRRWRLDLGPGLEHIGMPRFTTWLCGALLAVSTGASLAQAVAAPDVDPATLVRRPRASWSQAEREYGFSHWDRLFEARTIQRGEHVRALPPGAGLATFEPGYYTFQLNVRDLNAPRDSAAFKGIDRQEEFIVLKPDGTVPERAASKAAAPTPRPKKP